MSNSEPSAAATTAGLDLTPAVSEFVAAVNGRNVDKLVSCFAEHAIVNDQLVEHQGSADISRWATDEILADRLSLQVIAAQRHGVTEVMTAKVDGDFDKRGLPDPLLLRFYVAIDDDLIVQMIILRVQTC